MVHSSSGGGSETSAVMHRTRNWPQIVSYLGSGSSILVGSAVLLGWAFDLSALQGVGVVPDSPSMKANTALAFVLAGFSLLSLKATRPNRWTRTLAQVFPVIVALLGLLSLSEYLSGWNLGIDHMLFREPPGTVGTSDPGRMAAASAVNFSLLGLALLFPGRKTRLGLSSSEILIVPAMFLAAIALMGYAFGTPDLTRIGAYTRMAFYTSVTFIALGLGILLAYPNEGLAAIFLADRAGGYMGRRLLPLVLAGTLVSGWLATVGETQGLYGPGTAHALIILAVMVVAAGAIFWNARSLNASDERRDQAEQATRESEQIMREFMEHLPVGIAISTPGGSTVYANSALLSIVGNPSLEDFRRTSAPSFYAHPQDRDRFIELLRCGTVKDFEFQYRLVDGALGWGSVTALMQKTPFGESQIVSVFQDVTERKRAEEIRSRLGAIVESSEDAILSKTLDGIIVTWNRGAEQMYGYTAEEAIGKHISMLASKDHIDEIPELLQKVKAGEAIPYFETIRFKKDRTAVHVSLSMSPIRDASSRITGVSTIARDITKRKNAEEQIVRQAKELARSNAELERFAYVASHDLQEPLRMVASYTQLLAKRYKGKLDKEADEFIGFAVDGASRMQSLITDLLAYSRVGSKGKEFQPTDVNAVVDEALSGLRLAIEESDAEITRDSLPTVMADQAQLAQLLLNLVGNAIKFHGEARPKVHVSARREGDEWVFSVRDNGMGIDPKYFDRLFVLFQRLHSRKEYPGTGIGLALCKRIVERHGGRIWVQSEPSKGSTFYFTIPARGG